MADTYRNRRDRVEYIQPLTLSTVYYQGDEEEDAARITQG